MKHPEKARPPPWPYSWPVLPSGPIPSNFLWSCWTPAHCKEWAGVLFPSLKINFQVPVHCCKCVANGRKRQRLSATAKYWTCWTATVSGCLRRCEAPQILNLFIIPYQSLLVSMRRYSPLLPVKKISETHNPYMTRAWKSFSLCPKWHSRKRISPPIPATAK